MAEHILRPGQTLRELRREVYRWSQDDEREARELRNWRSIDESPQWGYYNGEPVTTQRLYDLGLRFFVPRPSSGNPIYR